jgi:hypothetical protein
MGPKLRHPMVLFVYTDNLVISVVKTGPAVTDVALVQYRVTDSGIPPRLFQQSTLNASGYQWSSSAVQSSRGVVVVNVIG